MLVLNNPELSKLLSTPMANNLNVRFATSEDIPEVVRIVTQLTPPDKQPNYRLAQDKFERAIQNNPDYFLWVAETAAGDIVGTGMMHLQHKLSYHCGTAAHIEDVVVDETVRGHGVGEAIVQEAVITAINHFCYKVMLTCFAKTATYYEKFGFVQHDIGMKLTLKDPYPDDE